MSVVHEMLKEAEQERIIMPRRPKQDERKGIFVFDLPRELLNDFYDLKEYVRISTLRDDVRVLSIANSLNGEGSSTIATYLSFLMGGGLIKRAEDAIQKPDDDQPNSGKNQPGENLFNMSAEKSDNYAEKQNDQQNVFLDWQDDVESVDEYENAREDVLLVDGNMHQPHLHRFFGVQPDNGLAEVIENGLDWREVMLSIRDSNLRFITAGSAQMNPTELIGSDQFQQLVMEWKNYFRYVIFDSPAVLTHADALSMAAIVDGVVLVVRAGHTRWDIAQNAKRKLTTARANLLGVTLNRRKMSIPDGLYRKLV